MDYYLLRPHQKLRVNHTGNQALRKCCGCIHLRVGSAIACIIWAALSMYYAVISFQNSSPFYSYMPQAPLLIFGTANLLMALVAIATLISLYLNGWDYVRTATQAIFVTVFIVLVDGFINVILFITNHDNYINWCINSTSTELEGGLSNATTNAIVNLDQDFYNCHRTWEDELKFGLLATLMMIGFYTYWALCLQSYSIKKAFIISQLMGMEAPPPMPFAPNMAPPPPPPPPAGIPMQRMAGAGRPNIIVLNNQKPSRKNNKTFSFRKARRTRPSNDIRISMPSSPPPPYFKETSKDCPTVFVLPDHRN